MSVLLQLRSALEAADPRDLLLIGHDERRRLADTLRAWAYVTDEADRLARAEAMLPPVLEQLDRPPPLRPSQLRTHCKQGHPQTDDDRSYGRCRACSIASGREWRRRRRAFRNSVLEVAP